MSLYTYLSVVKNTATIDVASANADLANTGVRELIDGDFTTSDFIKVTEKNLSFFDRDDGTHSNHINVWGCFYTNEMRALSSHIIDGELVLMLDVEGNPNEYFKLTPHRVEKVTPTF